MKKKNDKTKLWNVFIRPNFISEYTHGNERFHWNQHVVLQWSEFSMQCWLAFQFNTIPKARPHHLKSRMFVNPTCLIFPKKSFSDESAASSLYFNLKLG